MRDSLCGSLVMPIFGQINSTRGSTLQIAALFGASFGVDASILAGRWLDVRLVVRGHIYDFESRVG